MGMLRLTRSRGLDAAQKRAYVAQLGETRASLLVARERARLRGQTARVASIESRLAEVDARLGTVVDLRRFSLR